MCCDIASIASTAIAKHIC